MPDPAENALHPCVECGIELDADDRAKRCDECLDALTPNTPIPPASPALVCGLCRRYGHDDDACPSNPATWPIPPVECRPSCVALEACSRDIPPVEQQEVTRG